ncbi:MAG: topoisomerase C-terminal repeat-containing protein, partial [Parvibaculum sp.]
MAAYLLDLMIASRKMAAKRGFSFLAYLIGVAAEESRLLSLGQSAVRKHGSTNATLPKSTAPEDVTLEAALALIAEKEEKSGKKKPAKKAAAKKDPAEKKA